MHHLKTVLLLSFVFLSTYLFSHDSGHCSHFCSHRHTFTDPFANLTTQQDLSQATQGILFGAPITFETINPLNSSKYFNTSSAPVDGSIKILKHAIYEITFTVEAFALFRDLQGLKPTGSWGVAPQIIRRTIPQPILAGQVFASPGVIVVPGLTPIPTVYTSSVVIVELFKGDIVKIINASDDPTNELFLVSFAGSTSGQPVIPATNSASVIIKLLSEK